MLKRPFFRFIDIFNKEAPPLPYAIGVITYLNFAVYVGQNYPHRTKKGVSNYHPHLSETKKERHQNEDVTESDMVCCGNLSQPIATVSKASEPSVRDSNLSSSLSASFSPRLSFPPL